MKRLWTEDETRSICFQTSTPGVSVAPVAQRYAVNANQIFKWLRNPRFAPEPSAGGCSPEGVQFLPVEIVQDARAVPDAPAAAAGLIEIGLPGGQRMRITGRYDPEALARLIRGLTG